MLVRVDRDRVGTPQGIKRRALNAGRPAIGEQREEAAVRRIDMQARAVLLAEVGNAINAIDHPEPGRAERRDNRADAAGLQALLKRGEVERAVPGRGHRLVPCANDLRDARVRVVRLCARQHNLVWMEAAGHPERLEVRDRPGRRQVREMRLLVQHLRDLIDRLALEVRRCRPAIEGVVV